VLVLTPLTAPRGMEADGATGAVAAAALAAAAPPPASAPRTRGLPPARSPAPGRSPLSGRSPASSPAKTPHGAAAPAPMDVDGSPARPRRAAAGEAAGLPHAASLSSWLATGSPGPSPAKQARPPQE